MIKYKIKNKSYTEGSQMHFFRNMAVNVWGKDFTYKGKLQRYSSKQFTRYPMKANLKK
jgi:hypothetical protein